MIKIRRIKIDINGPEEVIGPSGRSLRLSSVVELCSSEKSNCFRLIQIHMDMDRYGHTLATGVAMRTEDTRIYM